VGRRVLETAVSHQHVNGQQPLAVQLNRDLQLVPWILNHVRVGMYVTCVRHRNTANVPSNTKINPSYIKDSVRISQRAQCTANRRASR
jgi:hypothetical protein